MTFQACNIDEARTLYDQLAVLAPIMVLENDFVCFYSTFSIRREFHASSLDSLFSDVLYSDQCRTRRFQCWHFEKPINLFFNLLCLLLLYIFVYLSLGIVHFFHLSHQCIDLCYVHHPYHKVM